MMRDDYLWDRSGPPDPEVERLEKLLGQFKGRHREAGEWAEIAETSTRAKRWRARSFVPMLATAAAVTIALTGGWWVALRTAPQWEVARLEGTPRVGGSTVADGQRLERGASLETDAHSRARIAVGRIGEVDVDPNTRLRVLESRARDQRMALDRGTIHARIWAPPRTFSVETPSAIAVDLGCIYSLTVDDAGDSVLRVEAGWVGFEYDGRESFVPENAMCVTRRGHGPGTPHYGDAPAMLKEALGRLDFEVLPPDVRTAALTTVLEQARPGDAFTLWHLLARVSPDDRDRVFDRLSVLEPPPAGVTREGIRRGNRHMLDLWWDELGLDTVSWWRIWKGPVPQR
jgi:hypothetical protein